jgi:hypothetical protein
LETSLQTLLSDWSVVDTGTVLTNQLLGIGDCFLVSCDLFGILKFAEMC